MSIVERVSAYLDNSHIHYQLLEHAPSKNALSSAIKSNIPTNQVVKGVVLEDNNGRKMMAVLPASHKISLITLNEKFHRQFHLIKEKNVYELFADCKEGAVPPLAQAYNMDKVYDDDLMQQAQLYLEAGDHTSLIKLTQNEFKQLMHNTEHLRFSYQVFH